MKNIKNLFVALVVVLVVVIAVTVLIPVLIRGQKSEAGPPPPPPFDVKVVNADSEPVPVSGTINVGNLGANPLPVRDVDSSAQSPITYSGHYTVPEGKRLLVKYISQRIEANGQCSFIYSYFSIQLTITEHYYYPSLIGQRTDNGAYMYGFSQETFLWVDENQQADIQVVAQGCTVVVEFPNVSGYLVDKQ